MLKTQGTSIYLTRGDTAFINITIQNQDGTEYQEHDGDISIFTVKRSTSVKTVIFQRRIDNGVLEITPADTAELPYGEYVYDCQLTTYEGNVYTFIPPSKFVVCEEVTF